MVKYPAKRLLKMDILDNLGQKIGRLKDIIIETRTGNIISLVIDKLDLQAVSEITEQLPTGESIIPISVAKFGDDYVTVDRRKLKLLSLKRSLKKRTILAKNPDDRVDSSL